MPGIDSTNTANASSGVTIQAAQTQFLFVCCQHGAEKAVKAEVQEKHPGMKFAYSRPGFLTFKLPGEIDATTVTFRSLFARCWGRTLGSIRSQDGDAVRMALAAQELLAPLKPQVLHVWHRDLAPPGEFHFEPGEQNDDARIAEQIRSAAAWPMAVRPAVTGEVVGDCIVISPQEWCIGWHTAHDYASCLPGGLAKFEMPQPVISRAAYKMENALRWSAMPVRPGDACAEIGCAPGGASQVLLARGLHVTGIDPAEVDTLLFQNPSFRHIRKRGHEVRCREFRKTKWLFADINLPPSYTLDSLERIIMHPEVRVRGVLATLKLVDWALAEEAESYVERVQAWGFDVVKAAQLQYHRQEFCVAAFTPRGH